MSGRSNVDFLRRVRLDALYVRRWSVGRDLSILSRTPTAVLSGRDSY